MVLQFLPLISSYGFSSILLIWTEFSHIIHVVITISLIRPFWEIFGFWYSRHPPFFILLHLFLFRVLIEELLMLLDLSLFIFHFLLLHECVIDPIIQISIVISLVLPIEVSAFFAEFDYFWFLWLQLSNYLLRPFKQLRVVFIVFAVRWVEWGKDNRFFRIIFHHRFILYIFVLLLWWFHVEPLELCDHSLCGIFIIVVLFFEQVLNHILVIVNVVCDLHVLLFCIKIMLCKYEIAIRYNQRVLFSLIESWLP